MANSKITHLTDHTFRIEGKKDAALTVDHIYEITDGIDTDELLETGVSFFVVDKDGYCEYYESSLGNEDKVSLGEIQWDECSFNDSMMGRILGNVTEHSSSRNHPVLYKDLCAEAHARAVVEYPKYDWGVLEKEDIQLAVKVIKEVQNCSNAHVSELFGISRQYLSELCKGYRCSNDVKEPVKPSRSLSLAICHILDVYA